MTSSQFVDFQLPTPVSRRVCYRTSPSTAGAASGSDAMVEHNRFVRAMYSILDENNLKHRGGGVSKLCGLPVRTCVLLHYAIQVANRLYDREPGSQVVDVVTNNPVSELVDAPCVKAMCALHNAQASIVLHSLCAS